MRLTSLEHQEARKDDLFQLAFAFGYLDQGVAGIHCNLTLPDTTISICYRDGSVRNLSWSKYGEDALNLARDLQETLQ